jgi:hypothetical protein
VNNLTAISCCEEVKYVKKEFKKFRIYSLQFVVSIQLLQGGNENVE